MSTEKRIVRDFALEGTIYLVAMLNLWGITSFAGWLFARIVKTSDFAGKINNVAALYWLFNNIGNIFLLSLMIGGLVALIQINVYGIRKDAKNIDLNDMLTLMILVLIGNIASIAGPMFLLVAFLQNTVPSSAAITLIAGVVMLFFPFVVAFHAAVNAVHSFAKAWNVYHSVKKEVATQNQ